ncbi:44009_t:CDS:2, partial [Gigaspora margarita]
LRSYGRRLETTSHEDESARKIEIIDLSDSILDQPIPNNVLPLLTLNNRIEMLDVSLIEITYYKAKIRKEINKLSIRTLIDVHKQRKYLLGIVENLSIIVNKLEILIDVEVTKARDYTVIVETDWLDKSYIVQDDKNEPPIVEIENEYISIEDPNTICWYEKYLNYEADSCAIYKELFKGMKMLEYLVDDLDKELGIKKGLTEDKELLKENKDLFAEGLTQLGRMKEEWHNIKLKEEAKPIKQKLYR